MKTFKNLYPQVYEFANLYYAFRDAARRKRSRPDVAEFEFDLEENLFKLQEELETHTYAPGGYRSFHITQPKWRKVSAAPFRDRVAHHALCRVIEPIFERRFVHDSYACRMGRGTHRALDRCQHLARRYPYVLQCDIRKFFPSIDNTILRSLIARLIPDAGVLWLVDQILESGAGVLASEYEMVWFPGDDLMAAVRPRGLPIGNLTSQFWANVYLNELDQFVKRELRCHAYLRYVDDFLLFAEGKLSLHRWRKEIVEFLVTLRLKLHERRAQVYPVETGIPFLGFRVYPDRRRLKPANGYAFRRRLRKLIADYHAGTIEGKQLHASVQGWANHARYGSTIGLRKAILCTIDLKPPRPD